MIAADLKTKIVGHLEWLEALQSQLHAGANRQNTAEAERKHEQDVSVERPKVKPEAGKRTPVTRGEDKENVVESKSVQKLEKWTRKPKEEPVGEEADPECTFKPKLVASQPETVPNETKLDVYERNQRWAEARRKRVEEVKRGDEGRDLDKCTFYPSTEVSQKSLGQVPPKDTQTAAPTRGIDKFIKRQEAARAMKEEKEKLLNNLSKGQSWKNKVTIPQSPRLGEHGSRREEDSPARGHRIKDIFNDPLDIHVTDVTWGEAVRILHDELQRLSFDFD